MARSELVDDELWELVRSLMPDRTPRRTGRPRVSDRAAFTAIVFVLRTGVPWRWSLADRLLWGDRLAAASGVATHRGKWERPHRELLRRLNAASRIDWSRGVVDSSHIRALRGGPHRALAG